jgi:hypothetical protein
VSHLSPASAWNVLGWLGYEDRNGVLAGFETMGDILAAL